MLWFDRLQLEGVTIYDPADNKMISVKKLLVNFRLSHLLQNKDIDIDGVYVDSAQVFLTKINESDTSRDLNINVFINQINEKYSSGGGGGKAPKIHIGEATVDESVFRYIDQDHDTVRYGFDYNHFALNVDESQLEHFVILGDTIEFNVNTMMVEEQKDKFKVHQLSTFYRLSQGGMEFTGLNLQAGKSTIADTVVFRYSSLRDLNDFVDKVKIHSTLRNTVIDPNDLAFFAPGAERLGQPVKVSGVFDGRIDKFKVTKMVADIGTTHLQGSLEMEGLPDFNETFIIANLKNSTVAFPDFAFAINDDALEQLKPLGRMSLDGQFLGYPNDFVATGNFGSRLGHITSDINLKIKDGNFDQSVYSGKLALINFNMGEFLHDTATFQRVNLNGHIKGSGLRASNADFTLDGKVTSIGLKGYNYTNITTNARFAKEFFNGILTIKDPNLQFKANGSIDFREHHNIVKIQASIDTAKLYNMNLTKNKISLHSNIDVNIRGLQLDSLEGVANLENFWIQYNERELTLDTIQVWSEKNNHQRLVHVNTTLLEADVNGDFQFSSLSQDVETLVNEVLLNITNDNDVIKRYYQEKTLKPKRYDAAFSVKLKNIKPLVTLVGLDIKMSPNVMINGKFSSGHTSIFQAFTNIDSLSYNGTQLIHSSAELTASKISDSTSVLAIMNINSEQQIFSPNFRTKNFATEGVWNKSHIDFEVDAEQEGQDNSMRLRGAIDFTKDSTELRFLPSSIKLLERDWDFDPGNKIAMANNEWSFQKLILVDAGQSVGLNGHISTNPDRKLFLTVDNLELSFLNAITGMKITGTLDAEANVSNYYNNPYFENDVHVDSLTVNDFLIGDITGKNNWDSQEKRFNINFFIDRLSSRIVNISGFYNPQDEVSPLNLDARLEKAELKIIEPFLSDIISQLGGTISGNYYINGKVNEPVFTGEGSVSNGQVMINYLKTQYHFTGNVGLTKNSIDLKEMELIDGFKNKGRLNGSITHRNFRDTRINLTSTFKNFQVLNTTAKDNSLFYGQGYATGNVSFTGPISNLKIAAAARSEKNTRIFIPIGGLASTDKKDFINFTNFNDTTFRKKLTKEISNKINLSGLTFDLNLDVTPDAYFEIIIDLKAGDIIRGRGDGDLQLALDTKGDFNMFGQFEFTEGWYNFTLYNIINKEFEIQKGSTITWYGDPYAGTLNINASYNQLASLGPILSDQTYASAPQIRRKYPVQVLLKLDGPMLSPTITFDIVAKDLPKSVIVDKGATVSLDLEFTAFKNRIDEQELKRQVFSLIVLRRFSPQDAFNTSGSLANSVSELFSNQLSNWMTQVDENLTIDVDLGSFDQETFNTFQLRLSYTFLNGRLRITRDGTMGNSTQTGNPQANTTGNNTNVSNIAGDWTVDYLLTSDGKFKVKMYNRTNVNPILNATSTQNTFTTGVSLLYTQSFNEVKDLLRSARNRRKREQEALLNTNKEATKEDDGIN